MSLHYKGIIHKARISDILKYFRLHFGFALQKQMVLPVYRNVVSFATVENFKSILIFDQIFWHHNNNDFTSLKAILY